MQTQWYNNQTHTGLDPLATNYFTGGQMGYMPNAQYLTDPSYGAFRTPQQLQKYPTAYNYPTLFQAYTTTLRGAGAGPFARSMGATLAPSPMGADQVRYQAEARRKYEDAIHAAQAGILDTAIKGLSTAIGFGLGGVGGAMLGYQMAPAIGGTSIDRNRLSREIQNVTESLVTTGPDVNTATGRGFSLPAADKLTKFMHHESAGDSFFNVDDYKKMFGMAAKSGMFDYANNVEQYKDIMKKMRKDMLVLMDIYETSDMADVFKHLQRMQTMGVGKGEMLNVSATEKMFSRMLGISHEDMINSYGQQGALMFNQYGLTGYQGSLRNVANVAGIEAAKRLGLIGEAEVNRRGGVGGFGASMTQELNIKAFGDIAQSYMPFLWKGDKEGTIDTDLANKLIKGEVTIHDAIEGVQRKAAKDPLFFLKYAESQDLIEKNLRDTVGQEGERRLVYNFGAYWGDKINLSGKENRTEQEKAFDGLTALGYSTPEVRALIKQYGSKEWLDNQNLQLMRTENELRTSAIKKMEEENTMLNKMVVEFKKSYEAFQDWGMDLFGLDKYSKEKQFRENRDTGATGLAVGIGGGDAKLTGISKGEQKNIIEKNIKHGSAPLRSRPITGKSTEQYDALILDIAKQTGVDPKLVKSVIKQESTSNPDAISPKNAFGVMQVVPGTAKELGIWFDKGKFINKHNISPYTLAALHENLPKDVKKSVSAVANEFSEDLKAAQGNKDEAIKAFAGRYNISVDKINEIDIRNQSKDFSLFENLINKYPNLVRRNSNGSGTAEYNNLMAIFAAEATLRSGGDVKSAAAQTLIADYTDILTKSGNDSTKANEEFKKKHGIDLSQASTGNVQEVIANKVTAAVNAADSGSSVQTTAKKLGITDTTNITDVASLSATLSTDYNKLLADNNGNVQKANEAFNKKYNIDLSATTSAPNIITESLNREYNTLLSAEDYDTEKVKKQFAKKYNIKSDAFKENELPIIVDEIAKEFSGFMAEAKGDREKALELYGKKHNIPASELKKFRNRNIEENIIGGINYLGQMINRYGDVQLGLAAYNAGPGTIDSAIKKAGSRDINKVLAQVPKDETRKYVPEIMGRLDTITVAESAPLPSKTTQYALQQESISEFTEYKKVADKYGVAPETLMALVQTMHPDVQEKDRVLAADGIASELGKEIMASSGDEQQGLKVFTDKHGVDLSKVEFKQEDNLYAALDPDVKKRFKLKNKSDFLYRVTHPFSTTGRPESVVAAVDEITTDDTTSKLNTAKKALNITPEVKAKGEKYLLDNVSEVNVHQLVSALGETTNIEDLHQDNFEEYLTGALTKQLNKTGKYKTQESLVTAAAEQAKKITKSPEAVEYLYSGILADNSVLSTKVKNVKTDTVRAAMAGRIADTWENEDKREKAIKEISPTTLFGRGREKGLKELFDKSAVMPSAYRALVLNNAPMTDESRKELAAEIDKNFQGVPLNAQGNFDEAALKKKLKEMVPILSDDDISNVVKLGKTKGKQLSKPEEVKEFAAATSGLREKEIASAQQTTMLGYNRALMESNLTPEIIRDQKQFELFKQLNPQAPMIKSVQEYKDAHGGNWDEADYLLSNKDVFTSKASEAFKSEIPSGKEYETFSKSLDELSQQSKALEGIAPALDNMSKAANSLSGAANNNAKALDTLASTLKTGNVPSPDSNKGLVAASGEKQ